MSKDVSDFSSVTSRNLHTDASAPYAFCSTATMTSSLVRGGLLRQLVPPLGLMELRLLLLSAPRGQHLRPLTPNPSISAYALAQPCCRSRVQRLAAEWAPVSYCHRHDPVLSDVWPSP